MLVFVQGADDVVRRGEILVAVEAPAGQRDQMGRIQLRVLAVDRDEKLHDLVGRQRVEHDGGHLEILEVVLLGELVEREQTVLAVQRSKNSRVFGQFERSRVGAPAAGHEFQAPVGHQQDASGDGRKGAESAHWR